MSRSGSRWLFNAAAAATCACCAAHAAAQHGHSDIEFEYGGGKIVVAFSAEGQVFESDFPTETSGLIFEQFTDDPGFDTADQPNGLFAGDIIGFNILGPLVYHDGSDFAPVPTGATIEIEDTLSNLITVTSATASASGLIDQASDSGGGRGDVHGHIDFTLTPASLDTPEYGAYGILMELTTDASGIANSDPFYIVFNFGLAEDENLPGPHFHDAVEDFAALVPEPGSLALMGLGGLAMIARRRGR